MQADTPDVLNARDRLIVALDFPSAAAALSLLTRISNGAPAESRPLWVKVGLELFLAGGAPLVDRLRRDGYQVFLDLKLHDIPNTVAGAVRSVLALQPALLTLHASGGLAMMAAAAEAAAGSQTRLLAVTVLTSADRAELAAIGIAAEPEAQVLRLAGLAAEAGIRGFVCAPAEAPILLRTIPDAYLVTPGIRPAKAPVGDQQRVSTPAAAVRAGARQLVVGRPITAAADPVASYLAILEEIAAETA